LLEQHVGIHRFVKALISFRQRCIDTALASPDDFCDWETAPFVQQPRSVVILMLPLQPAA
jgi:hypothetical protein